MRRRHIGRGAQSRQKSAGLGADKPLAYGVGSIFGLFFELVVAAQDVADRRDGLQIWCRHQQRCQRSVIEPEPGGDGQSLAASDPLRGRQQNLLLHRDMFEQPPAKLVVSRAIDLIGPGCCTLEQSVKP